MTSRSVLKREAIQKGEKMPEFDKVLTKEEVDGKVSEAVHNVESTLCPPLSRYQPVTAEELAGQIYKEYIKPIYGNAWLRIAEHILDKYEVRRK